MITRQLLLMWHRRRESIRTQYKRNTFELTSKPLLSQTYLKIIITSTRNPGTRESLMSWVLADVRTAPNCKNKTKTYMKQTWWWLHTNEWIFLLVFWKLTKHKTTWLTQLLSAALVLPVLQTIIFDPNSKSFAKYGVVGNIHSGFAFSVTNAQQFKLAPVW